jgi:RNA polymerase sigma-70 factor (ECF subfamily)
VALQGASLVNHGGRLVRHRGEDARSTVESDEIEEFVRTSYARVVATVALICGDHHAAEDAVQAALAAAWSKSERIESLGAWVTRVAVNRVRSRFRRRNAESRAYRRWVADRPSESTDVDGPDVRLARALAAVPRRQREVVVLHYYADHSVADVARMLGVSDGTVKTSLFRARDTLRVSLTTPTGEESRNA